MDPYLFDQRRRDEGAGRVAGIDEAGRGPIAGPVVAAAVVLHPDTRIEGLRDSKKVPEEERDALFFEVLLHAMDIGVGVSDAALIDSINVLEATRHAMASAVNDLSRPPDMLLVDAVSLPALKIRQEAHTKGEDKSASIAAASIVAKVVRDALMEHYHLQYPEYGFDKHKGYGTSGHMEALLRHGPCPLHRKTFRGVMSLTLPF